MSGNESAYEVELFKEKGFRQKKCPECNRFFWTLGDKETCGEPPCDEYSFIRKAALGWLAVFPGDLPVQLIHAQAVGKTLKRRSQIIKIEIKVMGRQ